MEFASYGATNERCARHACAQFLPNIPVLQDDGAARHLAGMTLPDVTLRRPPRR
jgi:hypothetical protein